MNLENLQGFNKSRAYLCGDPFISLLGAPCRTGEEEDLKHFCSFLRNNGNKFGQTQPSPEGWQG